MIGATSTLVKRRLGSSHPWPSRPVSRLAGADARAATSLRGSPRIGRGCTFAARRAGIRLKRTRGVQSLPRTRNLAGTCLTTVVAELNQRQVVGAATTAERRPAPEHSGRVRFRASPFT